jgi:iron complex outermembrane receptor protein
LIHRSFAVALAMVLPAAVTAQQVLPAVLVTGGQPTSLPVQIPTTVEGLTREQIERMVNASDSEDAIKYLPSLLVRKRYIADYNHAVLSTRASGTGNSARSLVYADGILLSNLLGNGATFAPRWMLVTPEEIERVDVLYGPFAAAYPGNSVGAVVDFVTRMPRQFEAHGKVSYSRQPFALYATEGSFDAKQASASVGNRSGDWSWFANFDRTDSHGQPLTFATRLVTQGVPGPTGTPVSGAVAGLNRSNQPWWLLGTGTEYESVQDHAKARVAYDFSGTVRATYTLGWWRNESQGRSATYLRDAAGRPVYSGAVNIGGQAFTLVPSDFPSSNESQEHVIQGLSLKSHGRGVWDWEIAASRYDYAHDLLRAPTGALPVAALPVALAGGPGRIVNGQGTGWDTLAIKGIWRPAAPGGHVVETGLQRDSFHLHSIENATADWIAGAPGPLNQQFQGDTRLSSAYVQDTWQPAPRWRAMVGLRVEHWEAFNGETANAAFTVPFASRAETHGSPKVAIAWAVADPWVLKASAGRAVRMPTVSELYQGGITASGTLVNNDPHLRPEQSWTSELTAERELEQGTWRITAFFEHTHDALYSQTNVTVMPNVTNIQNVDAIHTRGIESALQVADAFVRGVDLLASATFTDSIITRNDKFPASVGKWQPRVPRWRATAAATWHADAKWSWTLAARYSGRQYSTLDNSDPNDFAYQAASRYLTADLRARCQLDRRWSLAFGIDNLNNQQYWNFHPYPQRTYSAELRADL